MAKRRCAACGDLFVPRRNVPQQRYCSKPACQRTRRQRWQRQKLKTDADYRANQAAAQRRWRERHRAYWRRYRQSRPEYAERNPDRQGERNRRRGLQTWTRTWWKCMCFPWLSVALGAIAKRGLDGQRRAGRVAYGPWRTSCASICMP
jgi:hypothetical protein